MVSLSQCKYFPVIPHISLFRVLNIAHSCPATAGVQKEIFGHNQYSSDIDKLEGSENCCCFIYNIIDCVCTPMKLCSLFPDKGAIQTQRYM